MDTDSVAPSWRRGNYLGFRTKDDLQKHVSKAVMPRYALGEALVGEDLELVLALLDRHPRRAEKLGPGVARVTVERAMYGARRFDVHRLDGGVADFSYLKCIRDDDPVADRRSSGRAGLRSEIHDQVVEAKKAVFGSGRPDTRAVCPVRGVEITWTTAHVDHEPPLTFQALADEWLALRGLDAADVEVENDPERFNVARLKDRALAADFREFHRARARLRVVSAAANLSDIRRAANAAGRAEGGAR